MTNKLSKEIVNNLISLFKNNSFETLLTETSNLLTQFPHSTFLLNLNGIANAKLKKYKKSMLSFEKILSIDKNSVDTVYNIGNLKKEMGDIESAKIFFKRTIELNKNYYQAYNSLGIIFKQEKNLQEAEYFFKCAFNVNNKHYQSLTNLGLLAQLKNNHSEAINYFANSYKLHPNEESLINFGNSLINYRFVEPRTDLYKIINDLITKKNLVSPTSIIKSIISLIRQEDDINKILNSENHFNSINEFNNTIKILSKYHFFLETMKLCPLTDYKFEKLFVKIRFYLLKNISDISLSELNQNFIITLVFQCFVNEYIYYETETEIKLINELELSINKNLLLQVQPSIISLLCFCLYRNLNKFKWSNKIQFLKNLTHLKKLLISDKIVEHKNLLNMNKLIKISDQISQRVQDQYEENPYPRWIKMRTQFDDMSINKLIESLELKVYMPNIKEVLSPNILIAGCGTGQHAIYTALNYKKSNILAIDLSLSSLAYAKRKADEYGIKNINFIHSDLLDVENLNKKFDIIESVGVLHHMNDPFLGLKSLVNILKEGGLINIGLYSKYARRHISNIRKDIKSKDILSSNIEIKNYRNYIFNSNHQDNIKIRNSKNFYSTSETRDLLFHVQEHQFDLIEIKDYLKKLNLFFCGFDNFNIKTKFKSFFNSKESMCDLMKWNEFERRFPDSFDGMYQFYCQKI